MFNITTWEVEREKVFVLQHEHGRKWKLLGESWKFRIWLKNLGGKKRRQRKRVIKVRSTRIDGQPYQNWHRTEQRIRKAITLVIPSAVNALQNKYIFSHQCWNKGFSCDQRKMYSGIRCICLGLFLWSQFVPNRVNMSGQIWFDPISFQSGFYHFRCLPKF